MRQFKNLKGKLMKCFILLFLITMFLFPNATFEGASSGLLLWFHTILPTLLPFIIVSNLIIRLNITKQISVLFYPIIRKIFHVSSYGCYPILIGLISGIPVGAKSTADLVADHKISEEEGQFLITLCNNVSPMFVMSYIAITQLKLPRIKYVLFAILYCSAMISALSFRFLYKKKNARKVTAQAILSPDISADPVTVKHVSFRFDNLDSSIMDGFEVITKVGGYIILFSILAQIVNDIGSKTSYLKLIIIGILEITTGINRICHSSLDQSIKIVLIAVLTSFGGLSSMAQTKSVLVNTRLSIKTYCKVKVLCAFITLLITLLYVFLFL